MCYPQAYRLLLSPHSLRCTPLLPVPAVCHCAIAVIGPCFCSFITMVQSPSAVQEKDVSSHSSCGPRSSVRSKPTASGEGCGRKQRGTGRSLPWLQLMLGGSCTVLASLVWVTLRGRWGIGRHVHPSLTKAQLLALPLLQGGSFPLWDQVCGHPGADCGEEDFGIYFNNGGYWVTPAHVVRLAHEPSSNCL